MVNEDILMVLFFNCMSTTFNFSAQMVSDLQNYGLTGMFGAKNFTNGVLNQTAVDILASSIF
jgi:hypothetical protein